MTAKSMDTAILTFKDWKDKLQRRHTKQDEWIQYFKEHPHLDENQTRRLDSTLKKVTAFMKRVKNIGSTVTPESLLPELQKLNLSKYVDEIASAVCDAKVKIDELPPLVEFCVKAASMYEPFAENLVEELKKNVPTRRSDEVKNASKLRVDLRFISDLIFNGVIGSNGIRLLGSGLMFLLNTDKQDYVNIPIILPLCQSNLFDCTGLVPLSCQGSATEEDMQSIGTLLSSRFTSEQRTTFSTLIVAYFDSLIERLKEVRIQTNTGLKSIKRQERTKGDALPEDRQKYEELKTVLSRLHTNASELGQWTGREIPEMPEELSDDEEDELTTKRLNIGSTATGSKLFQDDDTRIFYEKLVNVSQVAMTATRSSSPTLDDEVEEEVAEFVANEVENEVDNINLSDLESSDDGEQESEDDIKEEEVQQMAAPEEKTNVVTRENSVFGALDNQPGTSLNMNMFLNKLGNAINKERIDAAALEFISKFNTKGNRKRLVQHLLNAPHDRLDLLPFYCRFMATIERVIQDVPLQVKCTLLEKFRGIADKKFVFEKGVKPSKTAMHVDAKVHLAKYISELVKFKLLPCAEGLACLRSLLVDLKQHKVDMICAMIESMGYYLFNFPETHAKMSVIIEVLMRKSENIKDERQKLLLGNAYFSVVPSNEEENLPLQRRPPLEEYIIMKVISGTRPVGSLRRLNWADEDVAEFCLSLLADPCSVPFEKIEKLAKTVGGLADYHEWIGIFIVDDVIEFIRGALEIRDPAMYQRLFASIVYIGQLYNYSLCATSVIFKILYQLISFGLNNGSNTVVGCALRIRRIRLSIELVKTVGEYFTTNRPKEKMDCFLNYLFLFHYTTVNLWTEHIEDFGEFPQDVGYELNKLLSKFRPKEKANFPDTLEKAQESVAKIQEKYKEHAEDLLKQTSKFNVPVVEMDDERRKLNVGENEDEEDDDENVPAGSMDVADNESDGLAQNVETFDMGSSKFEHEEEELNLREKQAELMQEDEDFLIELNRAMEDTFKTASVHNKVTLVDLEIPPSARQKFERKLTFADDTKNATEVTQPDSQLKMALMTKRGNRTVLKSVSLEPAQGMHEALMEQKAKQREEREKIKKLTLKFDQQQEEGGAN